MGIALGSDHNLWFTELRTSKIGQLNTQAKISESVTPTDKAGPLGIASGSGPALNLWFTEMTAGKVGQITTNGPPYLEYTLPNSAAHPVGIALGSDGDMWVTDPGSDSIWRLEQLPRKPFVKFARFRLSPNAMPMGITNGPDGALWFTEPGINAIGRLPISGSPLSEYPVHTKNAYPFAIAPANDNMLWFTEQKALQIGSIATTGSVTEYPLTGAQKPYDLIQGVDGNFYFTDETANKIGEFFAKSHRVTYFRIPTANSEPTAMTLGPDEQIYFIETAGNKIGQFKYF